MIKGTYVFYENGKEIARKCNVITKFGKRFITNFIAGNIVSSSKDMAFGIDTAAASVNDTRLGFEFYRLPVLFGSTDIQTSTAGNPPVTTTTYSVVYKTTIPQDVVGEIYEVGLYPSTRSSINNFDSKFITDFDSVTDWEDSSQINPLTTSSNYRIGGNLLRMSASSNSSKEYKATIPSINMSGYSTLDTLRLAYYKEDANLSSIKIRLYSDASSYYEVTVTPSAGTGYKISDEISISTLLAGATSPAPDITNINQVGIVITATSGGNTVAGLDGLRINDEDTFDPGFGLISRSSDSVPIISKVAGRQVDVEYRLDLDF
jgi:hypothetical protein